MKVFVQNKRIRYRHIKEEVEQVLIELSTLSATAVVAP